MSADQLLNSQQHVDGEAYWRYSVPVEHRGQKMLLLTIGRVAVIGVWMGDLGEYFLAWSPLLKRNKEVEEQIMSRFVKTKQSYTDL